MINSKQYDLNFAQIERLLVEIPEEVVASTEPGERIAFLITKNQPQRLSLTLPLIATAVEHLFVLDSSPNLDTITVCNSISARSLHYHGPESQRYAIEANPVLEKALDAGFITPFSLESCWDIWSKRNYAILYSLLRGYNNILLIDDDIIPPLSLPGNLLSLTYRHKLVGSRIVGMPDLSVVEHICNLNGLIKRSFVSGHFLAIDVQTSARYYFPSIYNEDWFFIMLNSLECPIGRYGKIFHLYWNPYADTGLRAMKEELGEIIVEGLARAILTEANTFSLGRIAYWSDIINNRRRIFEELIASEMMSKLPEVLEILKFAYDAASALTADDCLFFWQKYNERLSTWHLLVEEAKSYNKTSFFG